MDVDKLEKELVTMVQDDKLYWLRNDAKFRAAKDHVSYDEFEQRVKVSMIYAKKQIGIKNENVNRLLSSVANSIELKISAHISQIINVQRIFSN